MNPSITDSPAAATETTRSQEDPASDHSVSASVERTGFGHVNGLMTACLALGGAGAAEGAVVHVSTPEVFGDGDVWSISGINSANGGVEFFFDITFTTTTTPGGSTNSNTFSYFSVGQRSGGFNFVTNAIDAERMSVGNLVTPSLDFQDWARFYFNTPPSYYAFRTPFMGDPNQFHYGWARIEVGGGGQLTILEYAYEDQANTPIRVGQIPEPSSLGLLALGAAGLVVQRRRRQDS